MSKTTKDLTIITSIVMAGGPRGVAEHRIVQTKLNSITARVKALEAAPDAQADADADSLALSRATEKVQTQAAELRSLSRAHDILEEEVAKLTRELAASKKTHKKKPVRRSTKLKAVANETED